MRENLKKRELKDFRGSDKTDERNPERQAGARLPSIGEDHMEIQPEPSTLVGRLVWSAWWASLNTLSTK